MQFRPADSKKIIRMKARVNDRMKKGISLNFHHVASVGILPMNERFGNDAMGDRFHHKLITAEFPAGFHRHTFKAYIFK